MLEDLNVDLDEAQNLHIQLVAGLLVEFGLIEFMHHFWKRICFFHPKTWTQVRQGTVLRERCNYILGID